MSKKPSYDQLSEALFERFPSLVTEYENLLERRPIRGTYSIYLNVFLPFVLYALGASGTETEKVFLLLEELATNRNPGVQDLLATSILEPLVEDAPAVSVAWPHLGEKTRQIVVAIARAAGQLENLPRNDP